MIFLIAVEELRLSPELCFVIEDATSGVQAAKAGGMAAIGVARLGDQQQLVDAGAALVVTNLEDDMQQPGLEDHRLEYGAAEIPILELLCHRTSISVGPTVELRGYR
jgi:beta-phosphoglucomutase